MLSYRFGTLHQRTECVDSSFSNIADRAVSERQLGRGIQSIDYHPSHVGLWKRGKMSSCLPMYIYRQQSGKLTATIYLLFSALYSIFSFKQFILPVEQLSR